MSFYFKLLSFCKIFLSFSFSLRSGYSNIPIISIRLTAEISLLVLTLPQVLKPYLFSYILYYYQRLEPF